MNKQDIKALIDKQNPVILDIGSYNGKDAKEMSDIMDCVVHCFEPDPLSQEVFRSLHGDNGRMILYPVAVCNTDGEIEFYQSNHPQSNSIREPKEHISIFPGVKFDEKITVSGIKLDTWFAQKGRPVIDFIWADVNGAEEDLILGGLEALANTRYLYIECSNKELYAGQKHYSFIEKLLPDFKMLLMYNWGDNFGNILFKNMMYE
ncbi:MAG: FkbM family methyltransferase [Chitinophagaceae bacterium]|nr:FkbM family methyltransferase [Chitinophagaceae bacterium]